MSDFPQTWYRPSRWYGRVELDELIVHRETKECIWVQRKGFWAGSGPEVHKDGTPKLTKQLKAGATPSKVEALRAIVFAADSQIQGLQDARSNYIQRKTEALKMIAELEK
jgi:hypothetical protein